MLDDLVRSLQRTTFINPNTLAAALGTFQGYSNEDFSQAFMANGAVGPQAATVFSGASAAASTPGATPASTPPSVSITVAPVLNSGSASTTPTASTAPTPAAILGPQPPSLPALQTAPTFAPNFGMNPSDLLSDEVNLTYQFDNVRMLLERSLSDRLFHGEARLQAVMGFDIDIEPNVDMKHAVAVVDVTAAVADCENVTACARSEGIALVAMMPEEGSYNAATLSQSATGFGGAIASIVFSLGYQGQKRSQTFYLYRDMDTLSFQKPDPSSGSIEFGWQFRPVLGRASVAAGLRHMMVVLALPANDVPRDEGKELQLNVVVHTSWTRYESSSQTTEATTSWWNRLWGTDRLPQGISMETFEKVAVPTSAATQGDLSPKISSVRWVQGDALTGVAIVTGQNFFSGTTVRFGTKTYASPADGLVIKSDQQLEVALPLAAAVTEGVLSGRYGKALPIHANNASLPRGFDITNVNLIPAGDDFYQVDCSLHFDKAISQADFERKVNRPVVSINGTPVVAPSFFSWPSDPTAEVDEVKMTALVPSSLARAGVAMITVTAPFMGPDWSASMPYGSASLKVVRLGGRESTRLLISASDGAMLLCGYQPKQQEPNDLRQTWQLQLDENHIFSVMPTGTPPPRGGLACADHKHLRILSFDMPTKDINQYHRLELVDTEGNYRVMTADIPAQEPAHRPALRSTKIRK